MTDWRLEVDLAIEYDWRWAAKQSDWWQRL